jgi:type 1 glutamine amidotransferase
MNKKALIFQGGWAGHEPIQISEVFKGVLEKEGFEVEITGNLDTLLDTEKLKSLDLIIPMWTMGDITSEQSESVSEAIATGVGLAGCHGGMCDAFRNSVLWQFMTGGQWVAHPGNDGIEYTVNIKSSSSSPIIEGIKDFKVESEQYYLHVDPAIEVLATTTFSEVKGYHSTNGDVKVPVVWTKKWGHGRVFYNSLGHHADIFNIPEAIEIMRRGFLWAAEGKRIAIEKGFSTDEFKSNVPMH